MKKLIFFILILQSLLAFTQFNKCKEDLFPIRDPQKKMFGYVNIFGEWKIRPYYDLARPFKEGLAVVSRRKKFGLISCEGKVITPIEYDEIQDFVNGFAWVKKQNLWGLVDYNGKTVLECKYQEVIDVSRFDDYAWIKTGDLWGVYDKENVTFIHQPRFNKYQQLSDKFSLVEVNGKKGMIEHSKTEMVLNPEYDAIDKFAPYLLALQKDGKYGVVRDNGKKLLDTKYDGVKNMGLAKFSVEQNGKYSIYDVWGKQYVPFVLDSVGAFNNNAAVVKVDGGYGYINYKGRRVLSKYQMATTFVDGVALVRKNDKSFLINRKGEQQGETYDQVKLFKEYFSGFDGKNWKIFLYKKPNRDSQAFKEVYGGLPSRVRVKTNTGTKFYSVYSNIYASDISYDEIEDWDGKYALVRNQTGLGLIDSSLKQVLKPIYENIEVVEYLKVTYLKVKNKSSKQLMFNKAGKELLSADKIDFSGHNKFIVCNEGKCGVVTNKNATVIESKYDQLTSPDTTNSKYAWPLIVKVKGKYGLINDKAEFVSKAKSDICEYLGAGYFKLTTKGSSTFVNSKGEEVEEKVVTRKLKRLGL